MGLVEVIDPLVRLAPGTVVGVSQEVASGHVVVGADFHATEAARVSRRFAVALVTSTLEGQTLYRDAFQMLGFSKAKTFDWMPR